MELHNHIILFDGVCNLCNYWVNFAIKHNGKNNLQFAPLQSQFAKDFLPSHGIVPTELTSVVFYTNGKLYTQSSAALYICKELNSFWKILFVFIIVPKFIRDFIYNFIARNRYKWFGKKNTCRVPTVAERHRFLG